MKKWDDVYRLPLRVDDIGWIYDDNDNFIAQFLIETQELKKKIVECINGTYQITGRTDTFIYDEGVGVIKTEMGNKIILIRGWGYLTGNGGLRMSQEEAINIQDTFAEFIISKLTPNADLS